MQKLLCALVLLGTFFVATCQQDSSSGGFLADEIPLEVVTTTPTALIKETDVVFSRPVIALGSDFGQEELPSNLVPFTIVPPIAGRGRWVTTYIYRFDSEGPLGTDLDLSFRWNLDLVTYDGVKLTLDSAGEVKLTTPGLTMNINTVKSELANEVTGNRWNPNRGTKEDILPEVPPDGVIELRFGSPVNLKVLEAFLKVTKDGEDTDVGVFVAECSKPKATNNESTCANITLSGDLAIGTKYALKLGAGVEYGSKSGPLRKDAKVTFGGLRRFTIPFIDNRKIFISSPFLDLYLPHGLADVIDPASLPITIQDKNGTEIPFSISRVSKSTLRIIASVLPDRNYEISVEASDTIVDGFGLPLERSSARFKGAERTADFSTLDNFNIDPYSIFEADQDWGRQALAFSVGDPKKDRGVCKSGDLIKLWSILEPPEAVHALSFGSRNSLETLIGSPADTLTAPREDKSGELTVKDLSGLLEQSGAVVSELCRYDFHTTQVFLETSIQAIVLSRRQRDGQEFIVWVTSMTTAEPVAEAKVTLWGSKSREDEPSMLGEGMTDKDGVVSLSGVDDSFDLFVAIQMGSQYLYVPRPNIFFYNEQQYKDSLVVDRALVRPGETLNVKGYVMELKGKKFEPATSLTETSVEIFPPVNGVNSVPVSVNGEFGSYEAKIEIPEDVGLGFYTITFSARSPASDFVDYFGKSQEITVGEPRLPTIELTVDTPFWARPSSGVLISANIKSFIGSAVGGSEISVNWRIVEETKVFGEPEEPDDQLEGELTITTDDSGNGTALLDLTSLDRAPLIGSTLEIDLQLVGPTGELIEQSKSVRIEPADLDLSIERTVVSEIPNQTFGVAVEASDLEGNTLDKSEQPKSITIYLKKRPDSDSDRSDPPSTGDSPLDLLVIGECDFVLDSDDFCDFALPDIGLFVIEACAVLEDATVCERIYLGLDAESWGRHPLRNFIPVGMTDLNPDTLEIGDSKRILLDVPYDSATALITLGTIDEVTHQLVSLDKGRQTVQVTIDSLCEFGCGMSILVAVPRQSDGLAANPPVNVSKLFDISAPHSESFTTSIAVKPTSPTELNVTVSFPDADNDGEAAVVGPGDNTTISVDLGIDGRAEVTLVAVDKAVLDLVPYPLQRISDDFLLDLATDFTEKSSDSFLESAGSIQALIDNFYEKKEINPWFRPVDSLDDYYAIDMSLEDYIDSDSELLTIYVDDPLYYSYGHISYYEEYAEYAESEVFVTAESAPVVARSAPAFGSATASSSVETGEVTFASGGASVNDESVTFAKVTAVEEAAAPALRLESDFVATAFFLTEVTESGSVQAQFTAPANLGTFVVRAYAASAGGLLGSSESEIIVRRTVSLTPSLPRFVRSGDEFEAGAVVTVSGAAETEVTLSVIISGPLELQEDATMVVNVGSDGQEEARFTFRAIAVGSANLTLMADDGQGNQDALQAEINIMGLQEAVQVGTSFVVEGQDSKSFVEGIDLPAAIPGSGEILITAGVGRQPSVLSLADQILDVPEPFECPVGADFVLATVTIPAIIDAYLPWDVTGDEDLVSLIKLIRTDFDKGLEIVQPGGRLTTTAEGLRRYLACPEDDFTTVPSFTQNARGVFMIKLVGDALRNHSVAEIRDAVGTLFEARDVWLSVLEAELERLAVESRNSPSSSAISISTVAFGRACLGPDWRPRTEDEQIIQDLSMDRLSAALDDMSVEDQAYYVLALLDTSGGDTHPDVTKAFGSWTDRLRITGRTAYISAFEGGNAPATDLSNALAFLAFLRGGESGQLLSKLGSYVASPTSDNYGFRLFETFPKLVAMAALVEFDVSRGSAQPDLDFEAASGNFTLLQASFQNASDAVASRRVAWDDLPASPSPIEVAATGQGEASVSISLSFVPSEILPFPTYRGIFVQRSIQLEDSDDSPGLSVVSRGSVVQIKVQFLSPDDLGETVVRVLMPAGLEPVDPNISGEDTGCPIPFFSFFRFFYDSCPEQETRPDVVTFTFDRVKAGVSSVSFRAVAATAGKFTLPPTRVFANDQPEVMGLSSAGSFEVCEGETCEAKFLEPLDQLKSCPNDCSGSGSCNLRDGTCICFSGFRGDACEFVIET